MVRGWPGRIVRDSGWVSCSQFTPVENISFRSLMSYFNYESICFLMGWMFSHTASPEQQQYSYRQHGLCWSWTGGRCHVLHLTTYKAEREENDPQSFLHKLMSHHVVVEMLRDMGVTNHRSFTHFCIFCCYLKKKIIIIFNVIIRTIISFISNRHHYFSISFFVLS